MTEYLAGFEKIRQANEFISIEDLITPLEESRLVEYNGEKYSVIPVKGLLLPDAPKIHSMLGNSTYKGIMQELGEALVNDEVRGVGEFSNHLGIKVIVMVVGDQYGIDGWEFFKRDAGWLESA